MIANLQAHYGFTRMPFGTAIPIDALYASAAHKEAVARLRWLISARGLGALTGEAGCGKTVAVRAAVAGLDASRHTLIYLPNPQIGVRGIHGAIAAALGQAPRFHHATLIPQVEAALAAEAEEEAGTCCWPSTNHTCSPASSWKPSACSPATAWTTPPR